MFAAFHQGKLELCRLNFALLTLIPKEKDAKVMSKFRPISLLNCSYKIFTRVLTARIGQIADRLIRNNQTAFIKGRFILDSVVTAHEIIHSVYHDKEKGVILKLDYEKAYDEVNWEFLLDILRKRGFGDRWIGWIKLILESGSVGVSINNVDGNFFHTGKGSRKGDPLSPILFNLVVDVFTKMLQKASNNDLIIKGLGENLVENGVISLQYADDTILFLDDNMVHAENLK